jgi:hypothetical protein
MTDIVVYSSGDSSSTIGFAPPGTAVLSAVHVLHQASDLSVLPAPASTTASSVASSTSRDVFLGNSTTPPTSHDTPSDNGKLSTGVIIGIVIGSVVAALLLVAAAWYIGHSRRRSAAQKTQEDTGGGVGELHGEDSNRQELMTEEKVAEVPGSNALIAVELPYTYTTASRQPVELPGS